jgi:hypothetical protein
MTIEIRFANASQVWNLHDNVAHACVPFRAHNKKKQHFRVFLTPNEGLAWRDFIAFFAIDMAQCLWPCLTGDDFAV